MASSLCASLGFDEYDINNKFVVISEENGCDSSFMIASLLWKGLCSKSLHDGIQNNVCLLSLHNSLEHYENISIKLGFNISSYIKNGNLIMLEGFKIVNEYLNNSNTYNKGFMGFLKDLFFIIKENVNLLKKNNNNNNICIIIDDISSLLFLGLPLKSVLLFVKYCRSLLSDNGVSLIIGTYFNEKDQEQCVLFKNLYLVADYCISISGLKTGFSSDVSGCININRKFINNSTSCKESINDLYHFKLNDRQVKIFSPGSIQ
ncbi:elongator complex protein 6 isoform X1 [Lycorma delicatula]|uniref:elongator complex protein 6 isoform X1 n=1 Tax=Lycorma delicatula TaxID=130591 RepID=UPI003F50DB4D